MGRLLLEVIMVWRVPAIDGNLPLTETSTMLDVRRDDILNAFKVCKDCPPDSKRPAPHPGPRCATHHREVTKARKAKAHGSRMEKTYGITSEQYWAIHEAQGGACNGCRIATGASKRLAVDHDHSCCPGPVSCGRCVRQLLCSVCNQYIGYIRDNPESLRRLAKAIETLPAQTILLRF